jgi:GntR family transcriptional regulator
MADRARRTTRRATKTSTPNQPSGDPPAAAQSLAEIDPPTAPRFADPDAPATTHRRKADALLADAAKTNTPLYKLIAADLEERISADEFRPGEPIPSEAKLKEQYRASTGTVRLAVSTLRDQGLVTSTQGKRTTVTTPDNFMTGPVLQFDPRITRTGTGFETWDSHGWTPLQEPSKYRHSAKHYHSALNVEPTAVVLVTRRHLQHENGVATLHSLFLPLTVARKAQIKNPFLSPAHLYEGLTAAGHTLHWRETTASIMPTPDDTVALSIPPAVPLLVHILITHNQDGQPLALEETRLPSHRATVAHRQVS